jgi:hypothetical protein
MSQDDLSSRENQRPPGRRSRSTWISLNIAGGLAVAGIVVGITLSTTHDIGAVAGPTPEPTSGTTSQAASGSQSVPVTIDRDGEEIRVSGAGAGLASCSAASATHSKNLGSMVAFSFVNEFGEILRISWLNYQGTAVLYDLLSPGQTYKAMTAIGNVWRIATASSDCLAVVSIQGSGYVSVSG